MRTWVFSLGWWCVATVPCVGHTAAPPGPVQVSVVSSSKQYVVGEPVLLTVTVRNHSQRQLQTWVDLLAYQIEIYTAVRGEPFQQYTVRNHDPYEIQPMVERLAPGKSKRYGIRVLYTFYFKETSERRSALAFAKPGTYSLKVRYPLYPDRQMFESNTIEFRINEPRGVDARVFQRINRPEFLYFLQSGLTPGDNHDVVREAVQIVRTVPKSSYHDALRWSLLHYYRHETHGGLRGMDAAKRALLEEVRKVLGLPDPAAGPFPEDKRLDAKVTCYFAGGTPLEEAFKRVSEAGGVPLRLAPEMRARMIYGTLQDKVLRKFMDEQDEYKARWVRDGDGYKLVPAPDEKPKPR